MSKLSASVGGVEMAPGNWTFLAAIRVPNVSSLEDDIFRMISSLLQENHGRSVNLQNAPFLLSNRGSGLSK